MASQKAANADGEVTGKRNSELAQLANTKGVAVPADTDEEHKKKADDLSKLSG